MNLQQHLYQCSSLPPEENVLFSQDLLIMSEKNSLISSATFLLCFALMVCVKTKCTNKQIPRNTIEARKKKKTDNPKLKIKLN